MLGKGRENRDFFHKIRIFHHHHLFCAQKFQFLYLLGKNSRRVEEFLKGIDRRLIIPRRGK